MIISGEATDLRDIPDRLIERQRHYFATYKLIRGQDLPAVVQNIYGADHAEQRMSAAMADYNATFGL